MVLGKLGPEKVDSWAPKSEVNFMCEFLCVCVCWGGGGGGGGAASEPSGEIRKIIFALDYCISYGNHVYTERKSEF